MKTLQEYECIARKLISSWNKKSAYIAITDELIANIIYELARSDYKYNDKKVSKSGKNLTREEYRRMNGIYAIRDYVSKEYSKTYKPEKSLDCSNITHSWVD